MASAFYWECEVFRLAVAPWRNAPKQQQVVSARVAVAEQRTPGFALRFDLELLEKKGAEVLDGMTPTGHLMRLVNQRQMLRAFEFAFVGAEAKNRQPFGGEGRDELLDMRLKKWLAGGGQVLPPPKEELARWLLGWMLVTPSGDSDKQTDEWVVLMCGEKGAEFVEDCGEFNCQEAGDAGDPVGDNREDDDNCDDGSEETEDDDFPPPYEEVEATESEFSADEQTARLPETSRASNSRNGSRSKGQSVPIFSKRGSSIRSSSSRSLTSVPGSSALVEKTELKATIVRLNPRLDSLDMVKLEERSNEWSESRRNFSKVLHASRRDIQIAKQQLDRAEKLAQLRHTQLLKESARILQENEKKRRDAQAVRQLVTDTLEYRDELRTMESRMKNASIAAHRDQERVKRQTRAVLGHTERTSRRFGPPTKKERDLLFGDTYLSTRDKSAVYDLHGRHRNLEEADQVAKDTALESALGKIRRLLLSSVESVEIFRRYDLDRSGTLSYTEFQRMLRENGSGDSAELTREQSIAFFKRFDSDNSGEIDYAELLWGFFNWEAFLKRWYEQKSATTGPTDRKAKQLFKKYDPTGRGTVPLKEFQIVMDHLGVTLSDVDAKLLGVKFDAGKDGYIDYRKFLRNANLFESPDGLSATAADCDRHPTAQSEVNPDTVSSGMERIWMELQELSITQAKLHRLLQK